MQAVLDNPWRAAALGIAISAVAIAYWALASSADLEGAAVTSLRAGHVVAAFVWAGFIVFVNFVQLAALRDANETERPAIVRHIVPRTARVFTGAAHATLFTGILMLLPSMPTLVARPLLLGSVVAGVAMWAIVQFILRPNVQRITGKVAASDPEKAQARMTIARWARINLVLVIPTAVAMMIAAHAGM